MSYLKELPGFAQFKKMAEQFLDDLAGSHRPITVKDYRSDMRIYIAWLSTKNLQDPLNPRIITDYKNHLIKTSTLANSRRRLFCLKAFCKWAIKWDIIEKNPFDKIDMPAKPKSIPECLEKFELEYILKTPKYFKKKNTRKNVELLMLFLRDTMLRRREIINLSIEDIDFHGGYVKIHGKGGKIAVLPLSDDIVRFLEEHGYKGKAGPVFISNLGRRWSFTAIGRVFKKCVYVAHNLMVRDGLITEQYPGLKDRKITPHTIRHTMATILLTEGGAPIETVQELLRHTDISTTKIYLHIKPVYLKNSIKKYNPFLRKGDKNATGNDKK
ncbi:MAG: tyrosine-type recombinase/integrase [bacterium]|nr:tyrosine-type recombinase/integrase [bacterium]